VQSVIRKKSQASLLQLLKQSPTAFSRALSLDSNLEASSNRGSAVDSDIRLYPLMSLEIALLYCCDADTVLTHARVLSRLILRFFHHEYQEGPQGNSYDFLKDNLASCVK
jgi:hypothetical protein